MAFTLFSDQRECHEKNRQIVFSCVMMSLRESVNPTKIRSEVIGKSLPIYATLLLLAAFEGGSVMESKVCGKCKTKYPISNFGKTKHTKTGINYSCKKCVNKMGKIYRDRMNKETNNLFSVYADMKSRCFHKYNKRYMRYGGRGITICKKWLDDRGLFYSWAKSHGYKRGLEIDRINNDGDYSPKNCRFVSQIENARNKGNVKLNVEKILKIRQMIKSEIPLKIIASKFEVSRKTVNNVKLGSSWGDI